MVLRWLPLALAVTLIHAAGPMAARAGIVANGAYTRDVETGLEYVDIGITKGQFPSTFVQFGTWNSIHPSYPGFRLATTAEAVSLMAAVGVGPGVFSSLAYYAPVTTLHTFMGPPRAVNSFIDEFEMATRDDISQPWENPKMRSFNFWANHNSFSGGIWEDSHSWSFSDSRAGVLLVRDYANGVASDALGASVFGAGSLDFLSAEGDGIWFDFGDLFGSDFEIQALGGANLTHLAVGSGFSDADDLLTILDPTGDVVLGAGDLHQFSSPVASTVISGLTNAGAGGPTGVAGLASLSNLPLYLRFDSSVVDVTAAVVPEPSTTSLLVAGLAVLGGLSRRRRSAAA